MGPPPEGGGGSVTWWSRVLIVDGVAGFLIGAIDPLKGSIVILTGSVLVAYGPCCELGPCGWAGICQDLSRRLNQNLLRRVVRRADLVVDVSLEGSERCFRFLR